MPRFLLKAGAKDFDALFQALLTARGGGEEKSALVQKTRRIINDVRRRGDAALTDAAKRYDGIALRPHELAIPKEAIGESEKALPPDTLKALRHAAERIRAFHVAQKPEAIEIHDEEGVEMGLRWTPLASAGLYCPGGTASYPSSLLMNAIPAKIAGVARLVVATPPRPSPLLLAAAHIAEVEEIWQMGGAQAIAALAFGTESVGAVDKIFGPGNAYVAEAKRQLFGLVGIDMIAGPSEILVLADETANPEWIAADLLSQAEHDEEAQSILIASSEALADAVSSAVERQLKKLPRETIARASWENHGAILIIGDLEDAPPLIDKIAPEHLEILTGAPDEMAAKIRNVGAIFLGAFTPEAIGDYVGGTNHVLPTNRSARFASGLSVHDFMKRTSLLRCPENAFPRLAQSAALLAEAEGLQAHAAALAIRRALPPTDKEEESHRLVEIHLSEKRLRREEMEMERKAALHDLLEGNFFRPKEMRGPYALSLVSEENRLIFEIVSQADKRVSRQSLALSSFRTLIRDYFLICESYYDAIAAAPLSRVEELDRSRRALHNEGAEKLRNHLQDRIAMDKETARRLFTIICVMHRK